MVPSKGADSRAHFGPSDVVGIASNEPKTKAKPELPIGALQRAYGGRKFKQWPPKKGRIAEHTLGLRISLVLQVINPKQRPNESYWSRLYNEPVVAGH